MLALRHPSLRFLTALIALAWISAPVATAVHSEDHGHVFCDEHWRFEESSEPEEDPAHGEQADRTHEACAFIALGLSEVVVPPGSLKVCAHAPAPTAAAPTFWVSTRVTPVPVLHRAPKASPPGV